MPVGSHVVARNRQAEKIANRALTSPQTERIAREMGIPAPAPLLPQHPLLASGAHIPDWVKADGDISELQPVDDDEEETNEDQALSDEEEESDSGSTGGTEALYKQTAGIEEQIRKAGYQIARNENGDWNRCPQCDRKTAILPDSSGVKRRRVCLGTLFEDPVCEWPGEEVKSSKGSSEEKGKARWK